MEPSVWVQPVGIVDGAGHTANTQELDPAAAEALASKSAALSRMPSESVLAHRPTLPEESTGMAATGASSSSEVAVVLNTIGVWKQKCQPWVVWAAALTGGSWIMCTAAPSEAASSAAPSTVPSTTPSTTPSPATGTLLSVLPHAASASIATSTPSIGSGRKSAAIAFQRQPSPSPPPALPSPSGPTAPTEAAILRGKSCGKTARLGITQSKASSRGNGRSANTAKITKTAAMTTRSTNGLKRSSTGSGGVLASSPVVLSRGWRCRAATTRELSKPDKTIGTIEWARSNATSIAAAKSLRRHTQSTSRQTSISPDASHGSPPTDTFTSLPVSTEVNSSCSAASAAEVNMNYDSHDNDARSDTPAIAPDAANPAFSSDGVMPAEKTDNVAEELSTPVAPGLLLTKSQVVLLLRDVAGRLTGGEGRASVAIVEEQEATESRTPPTAQLWGSSRKFKIGFDSIGHALLPWPLPVDGALEQLTSAGKITPVQLAADLRRISTPGIGQYAIGQELVALVDGIWLDARVLQPPDHASSTVHKIQGGGTAHSVLIHPWNHAPLIMRCSLFNEVCARHSLELIPTHSFITDALSGQQLHVHHQCIPLDLEPAADSKGTAEVSDVGELYNWLFTAQAARRDVPSTLGKAARFASYGLPDEAADRVMKELADRLVTIDGPSAELKAAREAIQRAQINVQQTKASFASAAQLLLQQQKLDLDEHLDKEKRHEDELAAKQRKEQEELARTREDETFALGSRHKHALRDLEKDHQRQKQERQTEENALKRDSEQNSDRALKAFKDTQFKEADAFKRKLAAQRVDGESRLATLNRQEQEEFQGTRAKQLKAMEAKHEDEKSRIDEDLTKEAELRVEQFKVKKLDLETAHAESVKALKEAYTAELVATESAQKESMKSLLQDQGRRLAEQEATQKYQVEEASSDAPKIKMQNAQAEERDQIGVRHKDELKKFNIQSEMRRTALASKQEEERKAMFAMRRQTVAAGGENVKALQAQWAEDDRKNKNAPKKEAEALEAQIGKDKADLLEKQEAEGQELLQEQSRAFDAFKIQLSEDKKELVRKQEVERSLLAAEHEQNAVLLQRQHAEAMAALREKHEKEKTEHVHKMASEKEAFDQEKDADADSFQWRREEFRKDMATRQAKELEQTVRELDRQKKQLDQSQEERRKFNVAELDEELSRFTTRQDEERSIFVTKQKANEKALIEAQNEENRLLEARLANEITTTNANQTAEASSQEEKQRDMQTKLDSQHATQRSTLASEQQTAKMQFLAHQQVDRDQNAALYRDYLAKGVEHAQNELNQALLNKACFLLTGAPAAGKTCVVSQLMMLSLHDKKPGGFVPVAIKVQHLQRRLNEDRHEVDRRLKEERDLYYGEENAKFDLYTLRDLMRKLINGKKRTKDYFEQWDTDGNGTVDREEFGEAVRTMGARNASEEDIQAAFNQLDSDGSGEIDYDEMDKRLHSLPRERPGTKPPMPPLTAQQLRKIYGQSSFANAWNWVDAFLRVEHGTDSELYQMLRQALMSRRALIVLDGIDEGGAVRDEIERHVVEVLAKQGHTIVVTSRLEGLNVDLFHEAFEHLTLKPLTDAQQQQLIEKRLSGNEKGVVRNTGKGGRDEELLRYLRTRVPLDTETGTRMTSNPLMLSMIISLFENLDGGAMPETLSAVYSQAAASMLARAGHSAEGVSGSNCSVPNMDSLLEAIFFRAHVAQRRLIEEQHVEAAALELGAPEALAAIDWPVYKGRSRIGQVVKLLRGDHAGEHGVLSADARGTLINGKEPKSPLKVRFSDGTSSGWVRENDVETSGLDRSSFEAMFVGDGRRKAMRAEIAKLPEDLQHAVRTVRARVALDQLPLLVMLQAEPMLMQSAHLSFQEFYCARALHKGMTLPGEPPWKWSAWWANCLRLGVELGKGFGAGLVQASGSAVKNGTLNLSGEIGGHRPTSLSAIAELMQGVHTIDLSANKLRPSEMHSIASAISRSATLTHLNLGKNAIGDEGAQAIAAVLRESKLVQLSLFNTCIGLEGANALAQGIQLGAPSLRKLNVQYNALRGDSKKALEAANAARPDPLFLII